MDKTSSIVALLLLLVWPQMSLQQSGAVLIITPQKAVRGTQVSLECTTDDADTTDYAYSFFFLQRVHTSLTDAVKFDQQCKPLRVTKSVPESGFESVSITSSRCQSVTVSNVVASEQTAGMYRCSFHLITRDFAKTTVNSNAVELLVGDDTPEVALLEVKQAGTASIVSDNGEIAAGANVSVTCEANSAQPVPQYTISADGRPFAPVTPQPADNGRVIVYYVIPKQSSVVISCSLHNGFGTRKTKEMSIVPVYGRGHASIVIPDTLTQQTNAEIDVCSLANNPAKPLLVTVKDSDTLLQTGYPRYEAKDGYSRAYIKLTESTSSTKELFVTCGLDGVESPVSKTISIVGVEASTTQETSTTASYNSSSALPFSVELSTPNSAMITIGIVIAVVVVFIAVVSGVAIVLKRRSAANKASNSDKRYDKVGQNDADTYEANVSGKKPVTVQVDNYDGHQV